jgi:hypothetical protein
MKFYFAFLALLAGMFAAMAAAAFERDEQSMTGASQSARFSDPDEHMPVYMNENGKKDEGSNSAETHYEYDPQTGTYFPTNAVSSGTASNKSATKP